MPGVTLRQNMRSRQALLLSAAVFVVAVVFLLFDRSGSRQATRLNHPPVATNNGDKSTDKLHLLLPASSPEVNLCKTILTASVLGYPTPTLIAWNQTFDKGHLLGGGSHVAKISGVLEWLEAQDPLADDDLVLMMDAYGAFNLYENPGNIQAHLNADIWFQLRKETLISRYYSINAAANERISKRLGKAFEAEGIKQTIIFGAGKRCAPNQVHTVACYPIPESPLPDDIYGTNTDTIMGRNKYTSLRQRYLNSGYIVGPIKDMRRMFRRAEEKVKATKDQAEWDNGSHGSDFMYHGSDQSIFNIMLGEQEFQREVMRRRHLSHIEKMRGKGNQRPTWIEGTLVTDPLDPAFTHEPMEHKSGKPHEFGIGLDYFSGLGQQTVNSEEDARYLKYSDAISEQLKGRNGLFDCPSRVIGKIPEDVWASDPPIAGSPPDKPAATWTDVALYTNLCLNAIPVMIHHNGDKAAREWAWPLMWIQPHARKLIDSLLSNEMSTRFGGANTPDGKYLTWKELCPPHMDKELFRDIP